MKIKKFMKETGKELKKHSYNARSIMEELNNSVTLMDIIKDPEINPDYFVNDEFKTTYYKKDKTTPEADIAALKRYDIIIKHDNHPWIGYYTGRTPEGAGIKISLLCYYETDKDEYYVEDHSFGDSYFWYNWGDFDIYSPNKDEYYAPKTSGEEFNECLNESYSRDGDTVCDNETGFVYKKLEFTSDNEDDIYHELEKVQKGDLILMEINGVEKIRNLSSPIRKNYYVYVNTGHWSDYQINSSSIVYGIMGGHISVFVRDEHYDVSKGEKLKDTGEDWDEQLNESPRIPTLRRHGVAYHQVNSVNIYDEETLYDMLVPGKTIINVINEVILMSSDYHQLTEGKYEVMSKIDSPKRVYLKKTTLSRAHWYNLNKIFSAIKNGNATLWYPTEKADYTNSANIITDMGDDWIEESVDPDYDDFDDVIYINNEEYVRIPASYINNETDMMQYMKENNTYIMNHNLDQYRYTGWTPDYESHNEDIPYKINLSYKSITNGEKQAGFILVDSLVGLLKNEQFALYIKESEAKGVGFLTKKDIPSGEEFNESLCETSYEHSDEPGIGIIEYKGHKYYKVEAERHIHKQSDLMKYLVKGMTIFKGNPNGKELIYQGWEPQKCCGYKLNDDPYEIIFKIDGDDRDFSFSFNGMYGMLVNVEHLFDVYIPEELAERYGIKDEWELTSGDEFDECKNLKGEDLETLKEGTIISGKKEVKIFNKKGNYYNVISEGKKYKYNIDDLKYDYTHKKVKVYKGK